MASGDIVHETSSCTWSCRLEMCRQALSGRCVGLAATKNSAVATMCIAEDFAIELRAGIREKSTQISGGFVWVDIGRNVLSNGSNLEILDVSLVNLFLWSDLRCIPDLVLTVLQSPLYCEHTLTFGCLP